MRAALRQRIRPRVSSALLPPLSPATRFSTSSAAPRQQLPGAFCVDLVKQHDFDSYLVGLLMPVKARRGFFAIRAFNVETALIKDATRGNVFPGQMRMQWWREIIADMYRGKVPSQPVAKALAEAIEEYQLTKRWFDLLLEARMKDLDNIQPASLAELEEYADRTASSLLYLSLEALGIRDTHADHVASHLGKAIGITTLLRGTKYHASQGSLYIPLDLQREYKVTAKDIIQGPQNAEANQALADVFYEVSSHAHVHLEHARHMLPQAPRDTGLAMLQGVRTAMYLEALQKAGFNALDASLEPKGHFRYQLRLLWASWRGKV